MTAAIMPICVKAVRTYSAGEYKNGYFQEFLASCGITHEISMPHCQYMNGKVEQTIQTMNNWIRCALLQSHTKSGFWAEVGTYMALVENFLMDDSPDKELCKKLLVMPNLTGKLKIWGCAAYCHIPDNQ